MVWPPRVVERRCGNRRGRSPGTRSRGRRGTERQNARNGRDLGRKTPVSSRPGRYKFSSSVGGPGRRHPDGLPFHLALAAWPRDAAAVVRSGSWGRRHDVYSSPRAAGGRHRDSGGVTLSSDLPAPCSCRVSIAGGPVQLWVGLRLGLVKDRTGYYVVFLCNYALKKRRKVTCVCARIDRVLRSFPFQPADELKRGGFQLWVWYCVPDCWSSSPFWTGNGHTWFILQR